MTECEEVALTLSWAGIVTFDDALRAVTRQLGPPDEIGDIIQSNIAEVLHRKAVNAETWRQLLGHERRRWTLAVTP